MLEPLASVMVSPTTFQAVHEPVGGNAKVVVLPFAVMESGRFVVPPLA